MIFIPSAVQCQRAFSSHSRFPPIEIQKRVAQSAHQRRGKVVDQQLLQRLHRLVSGELCRLVLHFSQQYVNVMHNQDCSAQWLAVRPRFGRIGSATVALGTFVGLSFTTTLWSFNYFIVPQLEQIDTPLGQQYRRLRCVLCVCPLWSSLLLLDQNSPASGFHIQFGFKSIEIERQLQAEKRQKRED